MFVLALSCLLAAHSAQAADRPIDVIEHVIIFMQENRPFDHYFGKLSGVRGFNDRTTVPMRSGLNAFYQPIDQSNLEEYMLPFPAESNKTNAMCMPAPEMYYPTDVKMWNDGRMDSWNTARSPGMGMSYFTREDLPYYYSLYDNFATGDHYYQSTFTSTTPNRLVFFSGSNGLSVGEDAILQNDEPRPGYNWTTMGEILEEKNISWRVYQQADNFDDNAFAWFWNYQKGRPGDALFDKGMSRQPSLIQAFKDDLEAGTLPAVSWIIAPTRKSEHATNHPCDGEDFTARILATLAEYPDTYAKSAFILNYDEGGQFYDHAWTPTPPLSPDEGLSTVTTEGEVNTEVLTDFPAPMGLGFRVPLLIISPWTRGNIVVSEAFDHTSVIQFLEVRFNISCPNISPWRRAMTGDLMSAFDFENPNYDWPDLPSTSEYVHDGNIQCSDLPDPVVPESQSMPSQELGTRISRALPYEFHVTDTTEASKLSITVDNTGTAGAPFVLYDVKNLDTVNPRQYAVEAGKSVSDVLSLDSSYHYTLMGINGFVRQYSGSSACTALQVELVYGTTDNSVSLAITNSGGAAFMVSVIDNAYDQLGVDVASIVVAANTIETMNVAIGKAGNWYDLSVYVSDAGEPMDCFYRRFMGRMETGKDTISDPAMAAAKAGLWKTKENDAHPALPAHVRKIVRLEGVHEADNKDALFHLDVADQDL